MPTEQCSAGLSSRKLPGRLSGYSDSYTARMDYLIRQAKARRSPVASRDFYRAVVEGLRGAHYFQRRCRYPCRWSGDRVRHAKRAVTRRHAKRQFRRAYFLNRSHCARTESTAPRVLALTTSQLTNGCADDGVVASRTKATPTVTATPRRKANMTRMPLLVSRAGAR